MSALNPRQRKQMKLEGYLMPKTGKVVPTRKQLCDVVQEMIDDVCRECECDPKTIMLSQRLSERFARYCDALFPDELRR